MPDRVPNAERRAQTRAKLLACARVLFTEKGFAEASTDEIASAAGVTRGALYHQFADKTALFEAVLDEVEAEIAAELLRDVPGDDPATVLKHASRRLLELCQRDDLRRITLVEAPSVVGWAKWREIDARHGFGLLQAVLGEAARRGQIPAERVVPLAHLFLGAASEAALALAQTPEDDAARERMTGSLEWLVDRLLAEPEGEGP
ncbi:MAG: TetR/AcrR family transcriptional regulator [Myxococcota bacterium]